MIKHEKHYETSAAIVMLFLSLIFDAPDDLSAAAQGLTNLESKLNRGRIDPFPNRMITSLPNDGSDS